MRHTSCFDTSRPLIYQLYSFKANSMHFMSNSFFYESLSLFSISIKLHQRIALRYSFTINIANMRHTTCFDTTKPFIYHLCTTLKPIVCVLCHITSYTTPHPLSISIKLHQHITFRYSSNINRVSMRHTTCFVTPQSLTYHPWSTFLVL